MITLTTPDTTKEDLTEFAQWFYNTDRGIITDSDIESFMKDKEDEKETY